MCHYHVCCLYMRVVRVCEYVSTPACVWYVRACGHVMLGDKTMSV